MKKKIGGDFATLKQLMNDETVPRLFLFLRDGLALQYSSSSHKLADRPQVFIQRQERAAPGPGLGGVANFLRADLPVANWSPNWLGYSRYDGVVLTAEDLRSMPDEVRFAIGQYVECGGSLLVLGKDPQLPGKWKPVKWPDQRGGVMRSRLRHLLRHRSDRFIGDALDVSSKSYPSWSKILRPWTTTQSAAQANVAFPVVDDIGVPTRDFSP